MKINKKFLIISASVLATATAGASLIACTKISEADVATLTSAVNNLGTSATTLMSNASTTLPSDAVSTIKSGYLINSSTVKLDSGKVFGDGVTYKVELATTQNTLGLIELVISASYNGATQTISNFNLNGFLNSETSSDAQSIAATEAITTAVTEIGTSATAQSDFTSLLPSQLATKLMESGVDLSSLLNLAESHNFPTDGTVTLKVTNVVSDDANGTATVTITVGATGTTNTRVVTLQVSGLTKVSTFARETYSTGLTAAEKALTSTSTDEYKVASQFNSNASLKTLLASQLAILNAKLPTGYQWEVKLNSSGADNLNGQISAQLVLSKLNSNGSFTYYNYDASAAQASQITSVSDISSATGLEITISGFPTSREVLSTWLTNYTMSDLTKITATSSTPQVNAIIGLGNLLANQAVASYTATELSTLYSTLNGLLTSEYQSVLSANSLTTNGLAYVLAFLQQVGDTSNANLKSISIPAVINGLTYDVTNNTSNKVTTAIVDNNFSSTISLDLYKTGDSSKASYTTINQSFNFKQFSPYLFNFQSLSTANLTFNNVALYENFSTYNTFKAMIEVVIKDATYTSGGYNEIYLLQFSNALAQKLTTDIKLDTGKGSLVSGVSKIYPYDTSTYPYDTDALLLLKGNSKDVVNSVSGTNSLSFIIAGAQSYTTGAVANGMPWNTGEQATSHDGVSTNTYFQFDGFKYRILDDSYSIYVNAQATATGTTVNGQLTFYNGIGVAVRYMLETILSNNAMDRTPTKNTTN